MHVKYMRSITRIHKHRLTDEMCTLFHDQAVYKMGNKNGKQSNLSMLLI